MEQRKGNPRQSQEPNQKNEKSPGPFKKDQLVPIEVRLQEYNYPHHMIENYPRLAQKNLSLAELYRFASKAAPNPVIEKRRLLNPIQAKIDRKGEIWVDVLLEKKEGIHVRNLKRVMKIQGKPGRRRFFSGRVLVDNLPGLIEMAARVEVARPVAPFLDNSVPLIEASGTILKENFPAAAGQEELDGTGVIIGIVDGVLDFRHPNFVIKKQEGNEVKKVSRFLRFWHQNGKGKPPTAYKDGVEYDRECLNEAINSEKPYEQLNYYCEGRTEYDRHGTHVTDIAAGKPSEESRFPEFQGVAPGADIIYVHLGKPTEDMPKARPDEGLKSLGSSLYLYNAVKYIFEQADILQKPVVVNLSLGAFGGSHDGTSPLERKFDELLRSKSGRAIVIAAGNCLKDKIHTSGTVRQGEEPYVIEWRIPSHENRIRDVRQELEIWYDHKSALKVEVFAPDGRSLGVSRLGSPPLSSAILPDTQTPRCIIYHTRPDADPGEDENHINILVDDRKRGDGSLLPDIEDDFDVLGTWKLELSHDLELAGNADVEFHAWIERNDNCQSKFRNKSQQKYTLNSIGNAELPIVVGSFDYPRSSSGLSRNRQNSKKPELNAPGQDIFAARAAHDGNTLLSGTSMAAPHVTGVIALMFQAAQERRQPPKTLSIDEIRRILIASVDKNLPDHGDHDQILGFGRVNARKAIKRTIENP